MEGHLPVENCAATSFAGPEAFSPLVPVLLLAVVAARKMRQMHRHPYGKSVRARHAHGRVNEEVWSEQFAWQLSDTEFCPICCAEYLQGTERCEDCAVQLVDEEDLPLGDLRIDEGIVRIARMRNSTQGHLLRGYYSSNRIPCSLVRCTPCDVFGTDVYVFESDALRAKRLLRHFLSELECV